MGNNIEETFSSDGKYAKDDPYPSLFLGEFEIPESAYTIEMYDSKLI